jgi:hypothetical protein
VDVGTTEALMDLFGPWLPWLLGMGAVLLVAGLLVRELAVDPVVDPVVVRLRRGAASAG